MSRPLRIEYENAFYHVMNRGRGHQQVFHKVLYMDSLRGWGKYTGICANKIMALQIFNIVDNQDMVNLKVRLINEGWSIYLLPTPIIDKASFFQAIRSVFILDPPVSDNWDALSDSLWEGIFSHHSDIAIAIIWENSDMMANNDRKNFDIAVDVLNFLAKSINEWPRKDKVDKKVIIVLGSGAN